MNELDLAYYAGLVDGEGTITLTKDHARQNRSPVVSMTNTARELLDPLKEYFGGSVRTQKTYQEHHQTAWIWSCRYSAAVSAIEQLLPYLRHPDKLRRARLISEEYGTVTKRNGKYSKQELLEKQDFEYRFFHPSTP